MQSVLIAFIIIDSFFQDYDVLCNLIFFPKSNSIVMILWGIKIADHNAYLPDSLLKINSIYRLQCWKMNSIA